MAYWSVLKLKYKGVPCQYKPKDIVEDLQKDLGVNISYRKAWMASQCALEDIRDQNNFPVHGGHAKGTRRKELNVLEKSSLRGSVGNVVQLVITVKPTRTVLLFISIPKVSVLP